MKKFLILLLALSLTGCSSATKSDATKGEVIDCAEVDYVAANPDDTLLNCLTGPQKISVESLRGPLIVNVWGSWCGPCKQEMPYFVDFNNQAIGKVKLLGIAVEEANAQDSKDFIISNGMTWPNLYDAKGDTRKTLGWVYQLPGLLMKQVTWFINMWV